MNYDQTIEAMNIMIGDSDNVTFTPEEKQRAMTKAWADPYVVADVWNTAGSFNTSSYQTPIPSGLSTIRGIGVSYSTSEFPQDVDASFYDIVGANIQWTNKARAGLINGQGLYVLGTKKLDPDVDTLPTTALEEYVIALGGVNTLTLLGYKKANLFLKNDTSMGELITLKRELQKDVEMMRARFVKVFQDI